MTASRAPLIVHSNPKPGPGLEVVVPVKDTTEKTNYVALAGGIVQILASPVPGRDGASMVAIIVVVTR